MADLNILIDFINYNSPILNEMKEENEELSNAVNLVIQELYAKYGSSSSNKPLPKYKVGEKVATLSGQWEGEREIITVIWSSIENTYVYYFQRKSSEPTMYDIEPNLYELAKPLQKGEFEITTINAFIFREHLNGRLYASFNFRDKNDKMRFYVLFDSEAAFINKLYRNEEDTSKINFQKIYYNIAKSYLVGMGTPLISGNRMSYETTEAELDEFANEIQKKLTKFTAGKNVSIIDVQKYPIKFYLEEMVEEVKVKNRAEKLQPIGKVTQLINFTKEQEWAYLTQWVVSYTGEQYQDTHLESQLKTAQATPTKKKTKVEEPKNEYEGKTDAQLLAEIDELREALDLFDEGDPERDDLDNEIVKIEIELERRNN